ncbi:response regulator [Proteobacteria bacterium 005FR1]|nr:response regulator [Proteobacteria bacterium 005FR1]
MPGRILIVEDNREMREVMSTLLDMEGYVTLRAEHGAKALEVLSTSDRLPDLILLDLQMPVMGGEDFMAALPEARIPGVTDIPIVVVTASRLDLAASTEVLRKPFEIAELLGLVERYLD